MYKNTKTTLYNNNIVLNWQKLYLLFCLSQQHCSPSFLCNLKWHGCNYMSKTTHILCIDTPMHLQLWYWYSTQDHTKYMLMQAITQQTDTSYIVSVAEHLPHIKNKFIQSIWRMAGIPSELWELQIAPPVPKAFSLSIYLVWLKIQWWMHISSRWITWRGWQQMNQGAVC